MAQPGIFFETLSMICDIRGGGGQEAVNKVTPARGDKLLREIVRDTNPAGSGLYGRFVP